MIDYKGNEATVERCKISGGVLKITSEVTMEIAVIYAAIHAKSPEAASVFKGSLIKAFHDSEFCDTIFDNDYFPNIEDKVIDVEVEEPAERRIKALKELIKIVDPDGKLTKELFG